MQRDALALPPSVRNSGEQFEDAAIFPYQHPPNRGSEFRSDPGVWHVADVFRRPHVAPNNLGPSPPTARPSTCEHDRKQTEGVVVSAQGHEGVEVAQVIRRV